MQCKCEMQIAINYGVIKPEPRHTRRKDENFKQRISMNEVVIRD
jgi:hypothetical protein